MNKTAAWMFCFFLFPLFVLQAQDSFEVPRSKVIRKIDGIDYYIHTVAKGQTVYKISKSYAINAEELIRLNPEISDGMKQNQELRIPVAPGSIQKPVVIEKAPPPEIIPVPLDTIRPPAEKPCGSNPKAKKEIYDVALMMHFFLGEIEAIDVTEEVEDAEQIYRPFQFIQFYEGFIMAVDSLKKSGLSVRLHVYDVSTDTNETKKFLKTSGLEKMDMIIGLLYHRNFQIAAEFAREHRIPIISPVSERESQVVRNPWVIKVRPSPRVLIPRVAEMIDAQYPDANTVIVRNAQSRFKESADMLMQLLKEKNDSAVVTETRYMTDKLQKEKLNILALFSENKSSILDLLTQLNGIKNHYRITVFGLPEWDHIDGLEVDYLVNLKTHIVAPCFIDHDDPDVDKFTLAFQEKIKTDPGMLAFIGFDVAHFFLTALMTYGTDFPRCMNGISADLLESKFEFAKTEDGGYENQRWEIYYYENFRVYNALD